MSLKVRSFLAIDLDYNLKEDIIEIQNEFKKIDSNMKFVKKENFHLTLKFFGDITLDCASKISNNIESVLKNYDLFDLELVGCGTFANKNHIKVIWIGFKNNEILTTLQKELDSNFSSLKFKKEKNYKTHLTIARLKSPKNKDLIKEVVSKNKNIKIGKMKVRKISLKKSTLTPNGPIYEDLKVFNVIK